MTARHGLALKSDVSFFIASVAAFPAALVARFVNNYLNRGILRPLLKDRAWAELSRHHAIDRRPNDLVARSHGIGKLAPWDIALIASAGVSPDGVYVNYHALGRVLIPWTKVQSLTRKTMSTDEGREQLMTIHLVGDKLAVDIPWDRHLDSHVPQRIAIRD